MDEDDQSAALGTGPAAHCPAAAWDSHTPPPCRPRYSASCPRAAILGKCRQHTLHTRHGKRRYYCGQGTGLTSGCLHWSSPAAVDFWVHFRSDNQALHISSSWGTLAIAGTASQRQARSCPPCSASHSRASAHCCGGIAIRILFKWHSHVHGAQGEHDGQLYTSED